MSGWIDQMIAQFGYLGLLLLTVVETVFPPLPSEVVLPLGGYLVAQGQLTFWGVVLAGATGSLMGALLLYWLGSQLSRERLTAWTERYGGWLLLTGEDIEDAFGWFERHGKMAVFVARLVPGVRSLISIPAGVSGMALGPFLLFSFAGTTLWSGALAYAGMVLGAHYADVGVVLRGALMAMGVLVLAAVVRWVVKRKGLPETPFS